MQEVSCKNPGRIGVHIEYCGVLLMAVQDITGGLLDEFAGHSTCWIELSATDKITGPQTERGAEIASTIAQIHHPAVVLLHQELLHHLKQAPSKHPIYPRTLLNKHNSGKRVTSLTPMHRLKGQDSGATTPSMNHKGEEVHTLPLHRFGGQFGQPWGLGC